MPFLLDFVLRRLFVLSLALRLALLAFGEWQDRHLAVKYTDVDYAVFTDASFSVAQGGSPYERATYRYPPLFAWLLLPGHFLQCSWLWGKCLFVAGDLAVGALQWSALRAQGLSDRASRLATSLFLLSPIAAVTSTRGSADSLACALALCALAGLLHGRPALGGLALGLAVHVRIYPIIYALPCALHLLLQQSPHNATASAAAARLAAFGALAALAAAVPTGVAYWAYGWDAIGEAYLHHASRVDVRHNFSPLWLPIYMAAPAPAPPSLAAALPLSLLAALAVGAAAWRDLPACFFLQTLAFTALNKVLTAQYFSWWLALLPLMAGTTRLPLGAAAALGACWLAAELHWLFWAFKLELGGESVFLQLHGASLLLLAAHALLGGSMVYFHAPGHAKKS